MSIPKYIQTINQIQIQEWGMIDDLVLYPDDILVLGEVQDGDLLLVEKKHRDKDQTLSQRFARFYDGTLISEPHKTVLSKSLWEIVGAVKAIQRPLDRASLGAKKWYIKVLGGENDPQLSWLKHLENQALDVIYLQELGAKLLKYNSDIGIIAAWKLSDLENYSCFVSGHILFYPKKNELASGFVSTWAKASRREMRRNWQKRREIPSKFGFFLPIPPLTDISKEDRLASK